MLEQQHQTVDVKPLPTIPPNTVEETAGNDYPGQSTSDQKETFGLFKKLASKLKSPAAAQPNTTQTSPRTSPTVRAKNPPPLANDFTSKEQREAALRERGLIAAPKKDLSQIEQDLDQKYAKVAPVPKDQTTKGGQQSAAEKIRQEWKAKNQAGRI
ncbi:hypothetical protein BJ322DRAFT_1036640 [Thelephora terrestris]|uniref:Uncharacterized protein n=1 Tax=Thelephora terrestris TaxID=56493 RepID=A0A9P6HNK7_9AGAM|nr:hypothetical protein BJ322DRAFT_1036640 [Thelephora terrestris]